MGESEEKFLAKQPNGIPFVLEPLKDAGSVVGYVLRYPEKSNTFEATFRAPESELQEPLKYARNPPAIWRQVAHSRGSRPRALSLFRVLFRAKVLNLELSRKGEAPP